jgi:hypothetical protein
VNFKATFQIPNDFFQMIYEVTKFKAKEKPKDLPDMVRPGLFDNMQTNELTGSSKEEDKDSELMDKELKFADKEVLCDYIYEIIHKFRQKNVRQKNNISLIINII